jgi:hypothetical protein
MLKLSEIGWRRLLYGVVFTLVLSLLVTNSKNISAHSLSKSECEQQLNIVTPTDGSDATGLLLLQAQVPSYFDVSSLDFVTESGFIGSAQQSSPTTWDFEWDTSSVNDGSINIMALAHASGSSSDSSHACQSKPATTTISNDSEKSELIIEPNVTKWQGPTNFNINLDVKVLLKNGEISIDVTDSSQIDWITDIGYLSTSKNVASFSSGPVTDNGEIKITAYYGNQQVHSTVPVGVFSANEVAVYPYSSELGVGDVALNQCLTSVLGESYEESIKNGTRLEFTDLSILKQCFAPRHYVLPANLAPIDPVRVSTLDVDFRLAIHRAQQEDDAILFEGSAVPNTEVLLYIFSEPQVQIVSTDENGAWTYTLEDPLSAGGHQAFVVYSNDQSEFERSEVLNFEISQAPHTEQNPTGLSFILATNDVSSDYNFVPWVVAGLTFFIVILLFSINQRTSIHHKHAPKPEHHSR